MRSQTFYTLNADCLLKLFEYLGDRNLSSWFSAASTDKLFLHLAYSIVAIELPKKYYLRSHVAHACNKVMEQTDEMHDAKTQTSTAKYFLRLGVRKDDMMYSAARNGHVSTLSMLHQWRVSFWERHREVAFVAARHNQGNVIEFMQEHNLLLNDPSIKAKIVNIAIEHFNLNPSVIRAMGQAGFDFSQINRESESSISYMQQAMEFKLGEGKPALNKRCNVLLAMLESGSFPKMRVASFMSWMDEHFESEKPHFSGMFRDPMSSDLLWRCMKSMLDQMEKEKISQAAYDEIRPIVQAALIRFECEYYRLASSVNKTREAKTEKQACEEEGMELASAPTMGRRR